VLEQRYGVEREALEFFYAHAIDIHHGEVGEEIVLSRAGTHEAQKDMWMHLKRGQARQWVNFDVYYQAAVQAGEG
jgi:hypothetical protein